MSEKFFGPLEIMDATAADADRASNFLPAVSEIRFPPQTSGEPSPYYKHSIMVIMELFGQSPKQKIKKLTTDVSLPAIKFHEQYENEVHMPAEGITDTLRVLVTLEGQRDPECKENSFVVSVYEDGNLLQQTKLAVYFQ